MANPQIPAGEHLGAKASPRLTAAILAAMLLGAAIGALVGESAIPLGVVGNVLIQLIKLMAVPLVFFSIMEALVLTSIRWRSAGTLLIVVVINTSCALTIGLLLSNLIQPGVGFEAPTPAGGAALNLKGGESGLSLPTIIRSIVPTSILQPFTDNNVIAVVLLALLLGAAVRHHLTGRAADYDVAQFERLIRAILAVWGTALGWLVRLVPLAVLCVTARTVGEFGFEPFRGLARYVVVGIAGMMLQITLIYPLWIRGVAGISLRRFLSCAKKPIAYAFGTNSSLATLPLTLEALDGLGIPKAASRLGACIGTNLNNDGIVLYEAVAVLFVAQAYGVELSLVEQGFAALLSLAAAVGVAGVPEAGVISLSLVLSAVGLPLEVLPLLLAVDWIVARMRSVTNVCSDMTVSIGIAALGRRGGWFAG